MTISVALARTPGVLGDLLENVIERDPEFNLVARVEDPTNVATASGERDVDAVIVCTSDGSIPLAARRLLEDRICETVVAVSADGKHASLRRRDGRAVALNAPSPAELLDSIRPEARVNEDADA